MENTLVGLIIIGIAFFPIVFNKLCHFRARLWDTHWIYLGALVMGSMTVLAMISGVPYSWGPSQTIIPWALGEGAPWLGIDALAGLIATAVLTIGAVVTRYSVRYLEDDSRQQRFLSNLSYTLTSVLLMLVARNLALFFLFWFLTSYYLHQLLIHFQEREAAQQAANQKFWISRLGDVFILLAITVFFMTFQSLDFNVIFTLASSPEFIAQNTLSLNWGAFFLILGAMTKSAQFPFHFWLPNTLETPTPVSALMHAGIINAGGYLIIRMSPLLIHLSYPMWFLTIMGTITALYGTLAMFTQTSVKKNLAYSTIAQMGFMMLQCGLGAFAIATVHLLGHAFYKAYAFLSSGTLVTYSKVLAFFPKSKVRSVTPWKPLLSLISSLILVSISLSLFQIDVFQKPGVVVLGLILTLAIAQTVMSTEFKLFAWGYAAMMCCLYFAAYLVVSRILNGVLPIVESPFDPFYLITTSIIAIFFLVLYFVQNNLNWLGNSYFGQRLYVKFYNGFYWGNS